MVKILTLLMTAAVSSLGVPHTFESIASEDPNVASADFAEAEMELQRGAAADTIFVIVTQRDFMISPTGSFSGLGAAPAGPSTPVLRLHVPDHSSTAGLLLGSCVLGLFLRRSSAQA